MTEDSGVRVSSCESDVPFEASLTRQRKKRKWDQPAESLVLASLAVPGFLPLGNIGSFGGILPGVTPVSNGLLMNPLMANCGNTPQRTQGAPMQQPTSTLVSKLIQVTELICCPNTSIKSTPNIQDELIAREIVINDADSAVRYKLTKLQTQEEIQKSTGAVVITRGKYRPPNAPPDGEKPLYLHISAGAHLKDTAERILAVDRAATMVDEMLKQGLNLLPSSSISHPVVSNEAKAHSACVFLGFHVDPSLNIAAHIRGPNDQYINHIINETGATVFLRGGGSGNTESSHGEEVGQPMHLFLSSNNSNCLEDARHLAENLLDTICIEYGLSRVSSFKVYSAVPPPQQVYNAVPPSTVSITPMPAASLVGSAGVSTVFPRGNVSQPGSIIKGVQSQAELVSYSQPLSSGGTYYNGYVGIYPQATPLQQVALALRRSSCHVISNVAPTTSVAGSESKSNASSSSKKPPPQKRKFQEGPVGSMGFSKLNQDSEIRKPVEPSALGVRNVSNMPAPKKFVSPTSNGVLPTPPSIMPPPPPPKFSSSAPAPKVDGKTNILNKTKSDCVPETLVKLMEYGDDDYLEETCESVGGNSGAVSARKPFWAP